jgi:uncharacterized protein (TIGR03790 family)
MLRFMSAHRTPAWLTCAGAVLLVLFGFPRASSAQSPENVLVVVNSNSTDSTEIGEYYAKARNIPRNQIARISAATADVVTRSGYELTIQQPIAAWLAKHLLQDKVLYIVLTKGVPLRIEGSIGRDGTSASVDSELTLLYQRMTGQTVTVIGRRDNPYYLGDRSLELAFPFARARHEIYLVSRLDGFTVADVKALIDRSLRPSTTGRVLLDQRFGADDRSGDQWLSEAADRLGAIGQSPRVQIDATRAPLTTGDPVVGYFSWGSNDAAHLKRRTGLKFSPGAIGGMFVSTDARTFREPPAAWEPDGVHVTNGQSLIGDLIREGLTGVSGQVAEPFLDGIVRPQVLFPAYLSGFSIVESFYLATPFLSWQNVVIGDPLCAPFLSQPRPAAPALTIDEETGLPTIFSERTLMGLRREGRLNIEGVKLNLKARSWTAQGLPDKEVLPLLVKATEIEPKLIDAQLRLALAYDLRGDFDLAIERYRAILAVERDNAVALNNLAYILAERKNDPKQALPLAEEAYQLTNQAAIVADTLGWIHHKLGNHGRALPYIERAARLSPLDVEVALHAAVVHAELGNLSQARTFLAAALKLDQKIAGRDDVKALQAKIK